MFVTAVRDAVFTSTMPVMMPKCTSQPELLTLQRPKSKPVWNPPNRDELLVRAVAPFDPSVSAPLPFSVVSVVPPVTRMNMPPMFWFGPQFSGFDTIADTGWWKPDCSVPIAPEMPDAMPIAAPVFTVDWIWNTPEPGADSARRK